MMHFTSWTPLRDYLIVGANIEVVEAELSMKIYMNKPNIFKARFISAKYIEVLRWKYFAIHRLNSLWERPCINIIIIIIIIVIIVML